MMTAMTMAERIAQINAYYDRMAQNLERGLTGSLEMFAEAIDDLHQGSRESGVCADLLSLASAVANGDVGATYALRHEIAKMRM